MNGLVWLILCSMAAFAVMSLGRVPPAYLTMKDKRLRWALVLLVVGMLGLIADVLWRLL